jgi:hypothetical protein
MACIYYIRTHPLRVSVESERNLEIKNERAKIERDANVLDNANGVASVAISLVSPDDVADSVVAMMLLMLM